MMSMKGGSTRWKTMKEAPSNNILISEIIKGRGGWIRRAGRKEEQPGIHILGVSVADP